MIWQAALIACRSSSKFLRRASPRIPDGRETFLIGEEARDRGHLPHPDAVIGPVGQYAAELVQVALVDVALPAIDVPQVTWPWARTRT